MASGFFLGGMAEGMQNASELGIKRDALAQDLALKTRGLDIQQSQLGLEEKKLGADVSLRTRALNLTEQAQKNAQSREVLARADKAVTDTMAVVSETISQSLTVGKDPAIVAKAIRPLVDSAKSVAVKAGRDPGLIEAQVNALFARPTGTEAATAAGTAKAATTIAESKALSEAGVTKVDKEKSVAENALRDDYVKASADFIKIRDAKNRIDTVESTGAGDIALVFQYMKILDPGSTVREGEFATASNAAGVPGSVIAQYNKIVGGGVLSDKAREEIKSQAGGLYKAQANQHGRLTKQYEEIAKRQGLNTKNVIIDMSPNETTFSDRFSGAPGPGGKPMQTTASGIKYRVTD